MTPKSTDQAKDGRLLVIGCGMLAREILAIKERLGLEHLDLTCLPAQFHFDMHKIAPAMEQAILAARAEGYRSIFAGYADCGTGGQLDAVCAKYGVERMAGPHCFAFYQGAAYQNVADSDLTSFYMTDFLCRQFDAFFMKPLGLDRHPELAQDYFRHYEKIVYLAQTNDPTLDAVAEGAAAMLGLKYERRFTGYGELASGLERAAQGVEQ